MDRHFALPIAFAAALHGALLFGFTKTSRPAPIAEPATPPVPFVLLRPEPEEVRLAPDDRTESSARKAVIDTPVPVSSPEPVAIDVSNPFTISPPPVRVNTSDMRSVLDVPAGLRDGTGDNPWGPSVIPSTLLDDSPRARLQAAPLYPFEAKREGLSGEVVVEFLVDETGRVLEPRVVRSTHRIFEASSLRAVAKWKFEPGRREGRVVRFRMAVPVVFNLND